MKANIKRSKSDDKVNLYTTPEWATKALIDTGELASTQSWWEPCCGMGHIADVLTTEKVGDKSFASDLHNHGYGVAGLNFLEQTENECDTIITNPPFDTEGTHFVMLKHALALPNVKKVAFFMPMQFLETKGRCEWLETTKMMSRVYTFADRVKCLTKGDPELSKNNTAKHFAWFIFETTYLGEATIKYLYKPDHMRRKSA